MNTKIFVNLPVIDLSKSIELFKKVDFSFNPQFTDKKCYMYDYGRGYTCYVVG